MSLTAWAMLLGGGGALATSRGLGESWAVAWTPGVLFAVGYVVTVSTACSFPAYFRLIRARSGRRART